MFDDPSALDTRWTAPEKTGAAQEIVLTLTVTDDGTGRLTRTAEVRVRVRENQRPTASVSPETAIVNGRGKVTLDGMATDPDTAALTYEWNSSGGGTFDDASALDTTWTAPPHTNAARNITLTLTVADDGYVERAATVTVQVTVLANQAPQVLVSPTTATVDGDGELALFGSAIDPEGDGVAFRWSSNGGGSFDNASAPDTTWTAPATTADDQNIILTLTATDDGPGLLSGAAEVRVRVPGNRRPQVSGGGGGGGGGGPPPVPIPSDADLDWNVTRDIESLHSDNDLPTGIWSDGHTLWVLQNAASGADSVFAYELENGERLEDREFELDRRNRFSHGIWLDDEILWVADSGQDLLFAYNLESGERDEAREIELAERNRDPRGIWSDGEIIYVLDSVKDALFAYDLDSGELLSEHLLDKLNRSPRGIWSDGDTIWVSDDGAKRLFAYELDGETLKRTEDLEFGFRPLLKAGNGNARGIWSDNDVMYVVDEQDDQIYTYNIPDAIIAQLASLSLSDLEIGEFSADRRTYTAMAATSATVTTVKAIATQEAATVVIAPSDADGDAENGHQVALGGETEITITVTSGDGSRTKSYRIRVEKPPCLTGLTAGRLSEVAFVGGSLDELLGCATSLGLDALYHYSDGWVAFFHEAPEFLNQDFRDRFAEGMPAGEVLIARQGSIRVTAAAGPDRN